MSRPHYRGPAPQFARQNDYAFILTQWSAELELNLVTYHAVPPSVACETASRRVRQLASRCKCAIIGTEKTTEAFVVFSFDRETLKPVVHALYTSPTFRRQGLATALLGFAGAADKPGWHTSIGMSRRRMPSAAFMLQYNPILLDYDAEAPGGPP